MLEILTTHSWLLEAKYFSLAKGAILAKMEAGEFEFDRNLVLTSKERTERYGEGLPQLIIIGATDPGVTAEVMAASRPSTVSSGANVAVIPLQGTMMKNGGYCSRGTKDVIKMISDANADTNISAIVLDIDSPGGAVDGTEALGRAVKNSSKPIVAFIDGLGASAAYWVASQTSHIVVNSETTGYVGSIGVIAMAVDQSQWLEMNGIKVHVIRSSKAVDKAKLNGYEPLTDEVIADYRAQMDIIHESFISAVKAGRGDKLKDKESVFTGKVYNGKEAKKLGLADQIGTLEDAVNKAAQLARQKQAGTTRAEEEAPLNNSLTSNLSFSNMKFPKLSALFGFDANANEETVTEQHMASAESAIAERDSRITALETENADLQSRLTAAEEANTSLQATSATQAEQISTLESWKAEAAAKNGKREDELTAGVAKEKAAYEIEADKLRAKAQIKK